MLERQTYLEALSRDVDDFIEVVRTGDLDADVRDCAGWDLRQLGRHVGMIHRWAYDSMTTGRSADEQLAPTGREELVAWLEEGAGRLIGHLTRTDPDTPTWTFGPPPRTVQFWVRRQPHEVSVHLYDAHHAVGQDHSFDAALAADGVDEVVTMFFPRQVRNGRRGPLAEGVRLVATDVGEQWVLAGDGTDREADTVATVAGSAADLYLLVWRRTQWRALTVEGDHDAVERVFGTALTP